MLILLSILTVAGTAAAAVFGISLKKYQKLYFEQQVETRKLSDEFTQKDKDKDEIISQHEHQLSELEQKIQNFDREKDKIYQEGFSSGEKQDSTIQIKQEYETSIKKLKTEITQLKIEQSENNVNQSFDPKIFLDEILFYQDSNFKTLDQKLDFKRLSISNKTENNSISLKQILDATNLEINKEYIANNTENNLESLSYAVIFSGNATAFLIDGELSNFLTKNHKLITQNANDIKEDLENIVQQRVDFLNNTEFQTQIKEALNQLEDNTSIENIYPCLYLPSENITTLLYDVNPDIFAYADKNNIHHYSPAGIVNIILYAKQTLFAEQNIIKYQILSDIIKDNFDIDGQTPDIKKSDTIDIETTPKITPEEKIESEELLSTNTTPELNTSSTEFAPENTIKDIPNKEEAQDSTLPLSPTNSTELNSNDTEVIPEEKITDSLNKTEDQEEINVDKFNIGSFLDGGNLNDKQQPKTDNIVDPTIIQDNKISSTPDSLDDNNTNNKNEEPIFDPLEDNNITQDIANSIDAQNTDNNIANNKETIFDPLEDNNTTQEDDNSSTSNDSTNSTPKTSKKSKPDDTSFDHINPNDFDIEAFLNDSK